MHHLVVISNMSGLKGRYNNFSIEQQWLDPDSPSGQSHVLSSVKEKEAPYLQFFFPLKQPGFDPTSASISIFADSSPGVLEREAELQRVLTVKFQQTYQPDFNHTSIYQTQITLC